MAARRSWIATSPSLLRQSLKELIAAIGGPERLEAILVEFYLRMNEDVMIGFFFQGRDLKHIAHKQSVFLQRSAGLPVDEMVKSPREAHAGLAPIRRGFFFRRIEILKTILIEQGLTAEQIAVWIDFEKSFEIAVIAP